MPIYEYLCQKCQHQFDALQKMADDPLIDCPNCDEAALKKLVSAPSFRLSGTGWYETDFKTDKDKRKNLAGGTEQKSGGSDKKPNESKTSDSKSSSSKSSDSDKSVKAKPVKTSNNSAKNSTRSAPAA